MPRPRVLYVQSHVIQYASPVFRCLAERGNVGVTVAYGSLRGGVPSPEQIMWDVPLLDGYTWVELKGEALTPRIRVRDFDVVFVSGYATALYWTAAHEARRAGVPVVLVSDAHTLDSARAHSRMRRAVKSLALRRRILRAFDSVAARSSRGVEFHRRMGKPAQLFPYVVDNAYFASRAADVDRAAVRRRLAIEDDLAILFVGRLVAEKRPLDVVRAIADVPHAVALIVGDGPQRTELERAASASGVSDRVRFLGFANQSELPELYRASDVLVLPSETEAFGLVVNEAFACGTPAVVSNACGVAGDLVVDDVTGFVVPAGDVAALVRRLTQLEADRGLARRLGAGAKEQIDHWGPTEAAAALESIALTAQA